MKTLSGSLYDYLLFYECAVKDWLPGKHAQKLKIAQQAPGTLMNHINWNVKGTTVKGDSGGNTKCGITHKTWATWYKNNAAKYGLSSGLNVNKMDKKGWLSYIDSNWIKCANEACSIVLFQAKWGGWSKANSCLSLLKQKADITNYNYKTYGSVYEQIADATHAFKNPMDAFQIIRNSHQQYLYDLSAPGMKNRKFRIGWMRREVATFQDDGLYVETGNLANYVNENTSLHDWRATCKKQRGKIPGYVKLCSWDNMPTNPEAYADIDFSPYNYGYGNYVEDNGGSYSPTFSSSTRKDPHLSASKKTELKKGVLLGSSFNIK